MSNVIWGLVFLFSLALFFVGGSIKSKTASTRRRVSSKPVSDPVEDIKVIIVLLSLVGMALSCVGASIQLLQLYGVNSGSIILMVSGAGAIFYFLTDIIGSYLKQRAAKAAAEAERKREERERPIKNHIQALERLGQTQGISELEVQDLRNTWLRLEPESEWVNDETDWKAYLMEYRIKVKEPVQ